MAQEVRIRGEMIRLGQLLKLSGTVDAGGDVKAFLSSERVLVNGRPEIRRGRQLHLGDVVLAGAKELRLVDDRNPA